MQITRDTQGVHRERLTGRTGRKILESREAITTTIAKERIIRYSCRPAFHSVVRGAFTTG
jgi:hypothetical protein